MVHDRLLDLLEADREVDLDVASSFAQTGCKYLSSVKGSRGLKPSLTFGLRRHVLHPKVDLCVWLLGTMFLPPRPHKQTHTHTHTHILQIYGVHGLSLCQSKLWSLNLRRAATASKRFPRARLCHV